MSQRCRFDEPGAWLHVMNRGVARRTVFERRADMRYFLACLARAVRAGWFEVHAFSLLATHFHLLIRSLEGEAWRGLRRVQNAYSRRFNIQRRRDGPLFRGRFCSKRVTSETYWATVVRYIDQNATAARLVERPEDWPYGSARTYLLQPQGSPWLERSEVESRLMNERDGTLQLDAYRSLIADPMTPHQRSMVARRLETSADSLDSFEDLVAVAPERVTEWMHRKARLADGTAPGVPLLSPETLEAELASRSHAIAEGSGRATVTEDRDWLAVRAGVLRLLCGSTYREIAARTGCAEATAHGRVRAFSQLSERDDALFRVASEAVVAALGIDWPMAAEVAGGAPLRRVRVTANDGCDTV